MRGEEPTPRFSLRLRELNVPDELLIDDLKRVAAEFGDGCASIRLYDEHGKYDSSTLKRRFRSWNAALNRAGLSVNNELNVSIPRLCENIEKVWVALGRQPRLIEMRIPLSEFTGGMYQRRFGSWNKALRAFTDFVGCDGKAVDAEFGKASHPVGLTRRGTDLRTRFRVMQRDGFRCRACGRSPVMEHGVILHVDHVKPWSKGGLSEFENLQTLCDRCNLGKGNLEQ